VCSSDLSIPALVATVSTVTSQTQFVLSTGDANDDAYKSLLAEFRDTNFPQSVSFVRITAYAQATNTITLAIAPSFTVGTFDSVIIHRNPAVPANFGDMVIDGTGKVLLTNEPANLSALAITGGGSVTVGTNQDKVDYTLSGAAQANVATATASAVWDKVQASHVDAGTFGELATEIAAILADTAEIGSAGAGLTALATAANLSTVDTVVDAIKVVTDLLPNGGALTAIGADTARLTAVRAAVLTDWINGGRLDLLIDAIKAVTDALPNAGALNDLATILGQTGTTGVALSTAVKQSVADTLLTRQMTESYAADATAPTLAQMMFMLWSAGAEFSISGTTITAKKLDGTTTSMTFALDDSTNPTSRARTI